MNISKIIERQGDRIKVNLGVRVRPKFFNFIITKKCNSRCTYCNIWKTIFENPTFIKNELTLSEIKSFVENSSDILSELEFLQLTGGGTTYEA